LNGKKGQTRCNGHLRLDIDNESFSYAVQDQELAIAVEYAQGLYVVNLRIYLMRYSNIANINLGHHQLSFDFENNLLQEQNAVMKCLTDQIKQHGKVVLSEFVSYVKETHGLSEFQILQDIFWIAQDFKIQFRINNKNVEPFKVKNLLLNAIELTDQLLIIAAETVDDSIFQEVRNLYLKISEEENIDDCDQYELGCLLAKKIRRWQNSFQSYKPSSQKRYFPGEKEINRWLGFIEDISTKQDSFSLISAFYHNSAQLLNLYAQEKRLTEFYTKHHDFWTTLIKSVEAFSENLHEFNKDHEVSEDFDRLRQILSSRAPYDMISEADELLEKVRVFNDMIVKEKTDQCRMDALSELDQMIEKMKSQLDAQNANMHLRNKALYSLRHIKKRVEKAESIHSLNLCLNDAEYMFDVFLENGALRSPPETGQPVLLTNI
jgi:hypothetical protein